MNDYEKPTKKEERKKKATFQNPFLPFLSFVLFCLYYFNLCLFITFCLYLLMACYFLCRWLWVIKTKENERKKKKQGVLEGCVLFSFLLFCCFLIIVYFKKFFWSKFGRFFYILRVPEFQILEILNYTFVLTLRWIWVCIVIRVQNLV